MKNRAAEASLEKWGQIPILYLLCGPALTFTAYGMNSLARIFVAVVVVALAACATVGGGEKANWFVLGGLNPDRPEIVLVRSELPPASMRTRFPVLLQIQWRYEPLPNGMPTDREIERGREIYSALDRIIEPNGLYTMSRTGNGGRTIYYYVTDLSSHAAALRSYFDSMPPISVRIVASDDPDWLSIREVLDAIK